MSHKHGKEPRDCEELFARLSAYLDGELSSEARTEIEEHLCGCPPCIEFVESLRRTVDLCRRFEPAESPGPVSAAAREQLLAACRKMLAARGNANSV